MIRLLTDAVYLLRGPTPRQRDVLRRELRRYAWARAQAEPLHLDADQLLRLAKEAHEKHGGAL